MHFKIVSCLIVFIFVAINNCTPNICLFGGKCGHFLTAFGDYPIPCIVNQNPEPLYNVTSLEALKQFAPELLSDERPVFCCDDQQVSDMMQQLAITKSFMNGCPSCYVNYVKTFLHMSCNPNQRMFLEVTASQNSTTDSNVEMLTNLTYYMSDKYAETLYQYCANVKMPQTNVSIMSVLCGQYSANECNARHFLEFIGRKDPSPFQIDFVLGKVNDTTKSNSTIEAMDLELFGCNEVPIGYSNNTCDCGDCPAKCSHWHIHQSM